MENVKKEQTSPGVAAVGEKQREDGVIDMKPIVSRRGSIKDLTNMFEQAALDSAGTTYSINRRGSGQNMEAVIKNAKEKALMKKKSLEEEAKQKKLRAKERQSEVARKVREKQLKRERELAEKARLEKEKLERERKMRIDCFKGRFGRAYTAVKVGKAVQTPYGIGKLVSAKGDIYKVDLSFGKAFVPASLVQGTPKVETPYGNGTIVACKGNMSKVKLSFGDAYVPSKLVRATKEVEVPSPPGAGLIIPKAPGKLPKGGLMVPPPPPINMPDPTQKNIEGVSDFAERKKALADMMAGKAARSDLFSPSSLQASRKSAFEDAQKKMNAWMTEKNEKDKEKTDLETKMKAIVKIQALARGYIVRTRKAKAEREAELEKAIIPIQALARGNMARKQATEMREKKKVEDEMKKRAEELKMHEEEVQKKKDAAKKAAEEAERIEAETKKKAAEMKAKEEEMRKREEEILKKEQEHKEQAAKKQAEDEAAKLASAAKKKAGLLEEGKVETDRNDVDADAEKLKELGEPPKQEKPACCIIS